jgi:hypothetical protein
MDEVVNEETGNCWGEEKGVISFPVAENLEAVAIKGANFQLIKQWSAELLRKEAVCRGWETPPVSLVDLIKSRFRKSDFKQMGIFFMVVMSNPVNNHLSSIAFCHGIGECLYSSNEVKADLEGVAHDGAFVFVRSLRTSAINRLLE